MNKKELNIEQMEQINGGETCQRCDGKGEYLSWEGRRGRDKGHACFKTCATCNGTGEI